EKFRRKRRRVFDDRDRVDFSFGQLNGGLTQSLAWFFGYGFFKLILCKVYPCRVVLLTASADKRGKINSYFYRVLTFVRAGSQRTAGIQVQAYRNSLHRIYIK